MNGTEKNTKTFLSLSLCSFVFFLLLSFALLTEYIAAARAQRSALTGRGQRGFNTGECLYIRYGIVYYMYVDERVKCRFHACAALSALFVYVRQSTISDTLAVSIPRE